METVSRNTTDLAADERAAIEKFLGVQLSENQRVIVQVMEIDTEADQTQSPSPTSRDYAIFSDLDDGEADALTNAILEQSAGRNIDI